MAACERTGTVQVRFGPPKALFAAAIGFLHRTLEQEIAIPRFDDGLHWIASRCDRLARRAADPDGLRQEPWDEVRLQRLPGHRVRRNRDAPAARHRESPCQVLDAEVVVHLRNENDVPVTGDAGERRAREAVQEKGTHLYFRQAAA